ncbi:MAG: zinc ribbon domain-containing protein [Candidatus Helarchaeota archaeon]
MEKLSSKVTKLLQKEKVDAAIELISKELANLKEDVLPVDMIKIYHLFYECYYLKDIKQAHNSLNTAAKFIVEEADKKVQYNQDGAVEDYANAIIRYAFGGDLENAEKVLKKMEKLPKIDRYESYHLASTIYNILKNKKIDEFFRIRKKYKKFFNEKENFWLNKEIEYYATPVIEVDYEIPDEVLAGAMFRLDIIIKNVSPNTAKNIESKIFPPRGFRFRNSGRQKIKVRRLEPNEHFRHFAEFFIDEKEYGRKNIEYQLATYEDNRGKRYTIEFPKTEINVGTQSNVFAGTIIQKAPKITKTAATELFLEITEEDKKSVEKLKKKKNLFKEILRKNEENLNKKIITNDEYMTKYVLYKEKLDEIEKYLEDLGYTEKEGYTKVTCIYDGTKFYVEEGLCPRCGDLYTIFFDEIVSILFFMIIHSSGVCIFNKDFGKTLDADLTSGLITAVQSFLGELTGQEENRFTEFSQSGFYILTCNGKNSTSAIVMSMRASDKIKDRLIQFVELFENKFENELTNFTGNLDNFRESSQIFKQFFPLFLLQPYQINYNYLQDTKLSSIAQEIIKIPEIKERRIDLINLDEFVEMIRKRLRRLDYGNLIAAIFELQEKAILVPTVTHPEKKSVEELDFEFPAIPETKMKDSSSLDKNHSEIPQIPNIPQVPDVSEVPIEKNNVEETKGKQSVQEKSTAFCVECGAPLPLKTGKNQFCINCGARQPD